MTALNVMQRWEKIVWNVFFSDSFHSMINLTLCLRVRVMKISCLMPSSLPHGSHDVKVLAFVLC